MMTEILCRCGAIQWVRSLICTIEGLHEVPDVRDGLVIGSGRPNAKAPSNIGPCLKKNWLFLSNLGKLPRKRFYLHASPTRRFARPEVAKG